MNFIDTHIHLQDFKSNNATDIINDAVSKGIKKMICVSIVEKDWQFIADLHKIFPDIIVPAFGLHPWYLNEAKAGWQERLEQYLLKYPTSLVGETGLDRYHDSDAEPQNSFFKQHIELAKKHNRPIIIHAVKSQDWLEQYWSILPQKFVFHSYTGRQEVLKKILNRGGYVSYSASILKNREKEKTLIATPQNRLLIETDAPFQGNYTDIIETAKEIAAIRGESLKTFTSAVFQNSKDFINVK